ncbi:hypothetical protein AAFC00_000030 [Neodothiora populina]|uniref:Uncharacterized protein n=1 Tax=Neodothiora populina TaxID=2781224 RepID=A0ABR3P154_9PEZI
MTYIRLLVLSAYIIAIAFSISSISMVFAGVSTLDRCRNSVYACMAFLFAGKLAMQLFLIERAHIANIHCPRRRDDPVWWISMSFVCVSVVALSVWTCLNPVYYMNTTTGRCMKGLPPNVVAPLQAYEVAVNLALTAVFIRILQKSKQRSALSGRRESICNVRAKIESVVGKFKTSITKAKTTSESVVQVTKPPSSSEPGFPRSSSSPAPDEITETKKDLDVEAVAITLPASTRGKNKLRNLAGKSLMGTLAILAWSITNNVIFYVTKGHEVAWLCFVQCNIDFTLSVIVLHWLTSDTKTTDFGSAITEMPSAAARTLAPKRRDTMITASEDDDDDDEADLDSETTTEDEEIEEITNNCKQDEHARKPSSTQGSWRKYSILSIATPAAAAGTAAAAAAKALWIRRASSVALPPGIKFFTAPFAASGSSGDARPGPNVDGDADTEDYHSRRSYSTTISRSSSVSTSSTT